MGHHTTPQARAALRGGFIALASLACMHLTALASEPMPRMPPERQPATWQQAGIEAALTDPDFVVQYHALDYCLRKKWVAQLHLPTTQWQKWLAHPDRDIRELAARAAAQLGAQMPKPRAIVAVSAHWNTGIPMLTGAVSPPTARVTSTCPTASTKPSRRSPSA